MAARGARMVDTMEALLGGPVYHFQSKLTAKEPFVGGAWEWHQDYGYWYTPTPKKSARGARNRSETRILSRS
jgi:hypothetical protein